jgi:starch-binding outer membrane protein, SusD/RagB family
MIMKCIKWAMAAMVMTVAVSCDDSLNEALEHEIPVKGIDYTKTEDMFKLLTGSYSTLNDLQWETFPTIAVRGDDVNAAGDQVPLTQTDMFNYDRSFWMYNSAWLNLYTDILYYHANMEQILKYREFAANPSQADQYIAEIKVIK